MGLLPKNEQTEKDITPKVFFIWGQSMHGKTYLARQFPDPVILNTDGNGKKITTPHVDIYDFETFVNVLREIEEGKHDFQTIVIDLVDDIKTFLEDYICKKYDVENLADAPFGKAFNDVKSTWKRLMIRLTQLPLNVIFISHIVQVTDEYDKQSTIEQPSLEQKFLNMTKGRTDVMIKCQKIGKTYLQICNERRDTYIKSDFKDEKILKCLENVKQLFDDNKPVVQNISSVKSEKPVIKTLEKKITKKSIQQDVPVEETKEEAIQKAIPVEKPKRNPIVEENISKNVEQIMSKKSLLIKKKEEE